MLLDGPHERITLSRLSAHQVDQAEQRRLPGYEGDLSVDLRAGPPAFHVVHDADNSGGAAHRIVDGFAERIARGEEGVGQVTGHDNGRDGRVGTFDGEGWQYLIGPKVASGDEVGPEGS